jgi:glycosyltransferase involved in cell wall biosynthesis
MAPPPIADVVVPVRRADAKTVRCLSSVLERSGSALHRLIVVGDVSAERELGDALARLAGADERVRLCGGSVDAGPIEACRCGLAERAGDAVVLHADTEATEGWLEELAAVAHSDDRTACASPLSNHASYCTAPLADERAVRAATAELPRSTVIPSPMAFCIYLRGDVLDLVGEPEGMLGWDDWAMRAQLMGFATRRANRALIWHYSERTGGIAPDAWRDFDERHPHHKWQVQRLCTTLDGPLAVHAVRVESSGTIRVALDMRHVAPYKVGTSVHAICLAQSLARCPEIELTLVVRKPEQAKGLDGRVVIEERALHDVEIIHKPGQVFDPADLSLLFRSTAHAVVSHLDLIAHRAHGVFHEQTAAYRYRAMSHLVLHAAQATIAISEHARNEMISEYSLPEEAVFVTPLGIDAEHFDARGSQHDVVRAGLGVRARYLFGVATDFPHKNLPNLVDAYGLFRGQWSDGEPPELVLAGSKTGLACGIYQELETHAPAGVRYLGPVSQEALVALYHGALGLVYPSIYEGFGLPQLEAMAAGTPVICMPLSATPEVYGDSVLYPDGNSPRDLAHAMRRLCDEPELRAELIERGRRRVEMYTLERAARATIDVYRSVVFRPSERSLVARRNLLDIITEWANSRAPVPEPAPSLRRAWGMMDRAIRARAGREIRRFKRSPSRLPA